MDYWRTDSVSDLSLQLDKRVDIPNSCVAAKGGFPLRDKFDEISRNNKETKYCRWKMKAGLLEKVGDCLQNNTTDSIGDNTD